MAMRAPMRNVEELKRPVISAIAVFYHGVAELCS